MLEVRELHFVVGPERNSRSVFKDVSLTCSDGELVALMGRSGSGKSSILRIIAGLVSPSKGRTFVDGEDTTAITPAEGAGLRRQRVFLVFQDYNVVETLTAEENVRLPLELAGIAYRDARLRARAAMEDLGIAALADQLPARLSGGEQQRVAVARAVVAPGGNILADEPTGAVDVDSAAVVVDMLRAAAHAGKAVLMVTHDPQVASRAHRTFELGHGTVEPQ